MISTSVEGLRLYDSMLALPEAKPLVDTFARQLRIVSPSKRPYLRAKFAGEFFELFAFDYLRGELNGDGFLLSPDETTEVMGRLSGPRRVNKEYGLTCGVGVNSMDGIRLRLLNGDYSQITGFYEYKLALDLTHKHFSQIVHYGTFEGAQRSLGIFELQGRHRLGEAIHEVRADIPDNPVILDQSFDLTFFVPNNSSFSVDGIIDYIRALGKRKHMRTEANVEELRRRIRIKKWDYNSIDFRKFYGFLMAELSQVNRGN